MGISKIDACEMESFWVTFFQKGNCEMESFLLTFLQKSKLTLGWLCDIIKWNIDMEEGL